MDLFGWESYDFYLFFFYVIGMKYYVLVVISIVWESDRGIWN